jgi:hypothetical protein
VAANAVLAAPPRSAIEVVIKAMALAMRLVIVFPPRGKLDDLSNPRRSAHSEQFIIRVVGRIAHPHRLVRMSAITRVILVASRCNTHRT